MEYVNPELLAAIDKNKQVFGKSRLASLVRRTLEEEANMHSDKLEHPLPLFTSKKKKAHLKKELNGKTLEHLTQAWNWALESFEGILDRDFVETIAAKIEPENPAVQGGYRRELVRLTGARIVLPNYLAIPQLMDDFFNLVNNQSLHPIDRALLSHFHIARIHPFVDSNGRTARLVQNVILHRGDYAPATVKLGERTHYLDMIENAVIEYLNRTTSGTLNTTTSLGEKMFFNYMASRVNVALEEAITYVDRLPQHRLLFVKNIDKPVQYVLKRCLVGYFKSTNKLGQVRVVDNGYTIYGDINEATIRDIVDSNKNFGSLKYRVERLK